MKKKLITVGVLLLTIFALVGCDTSETTTTTTTSSDTTTTTTTTTTTSQNLITNTATALSNSIPEECSLIEIVDGWVPVWCDEFSYTGAVDPTKWSVVVGGGGFGNNELQYYTSRTENLYVDGDYLHIVGQKESYNGYNYTSAKIWTVNTEDWRYGKFEMRAQLPYGTGTWPAFWMMPSSSRYGGWPNSGEIDIMEHVGYDMDVVHGTIHTERYYGSNGRGSSTDSLIIQNTIPSIDVSNEFHTYSIIWDETSITWYFDGYQFAQVAYNPLLSKTYLYDTSVDWPFDQYFYLILNLAIGGNWGGVQGVDDSIFPQTYLVDYVRVYQQDYVYGDVAAPSAPTTPHVMNVQSTTAYLTWGEASDDGNIAKYYIYVNGVLQDKTSVPGVLLRGLKAGEDNMIMIFAEDYAGNFSDPLETVITTPSS